MYLLQKKHFDILREPGDKDYNKSVSMDENLNSAKKKKNNNNRHYFQFNIKTCQWSKVKVETLKKGWIEVKVFSK